LKKVQITYNPYTVQTTILVDDKAVKKDSSLNICENLRLQEWVDKLPQLLCHEYNSREFEIIFRGTQLDFEDIEEIVKLEESNYPGKSKFILRHIPVKESADKESLIKNLFESIKNGPFDELRDKEIQDAFETALSDEFPINVIATMSAGKSTLINALLQQKLMPSSQEACTAIITEIHDNDKPVFRADVYDQNYQVIQQLKQTTLKDMKDLNDSNEVSTIELYGNIPFVESTNTSLVLIDSPGPNNARNRDHKLVTERALSESAKNLILYIMDAGDLGSDDDDRLIKKVADKMSTGGKQSRDRFIFVINKLDDFRSGEDNISQTLDNIKDYLEKKGIQNPLIFPISALTALDICTILKDKRVVGYDSEELEDMDDEEQATITFVKKFNRKDEFHLEKYASLPPSSKHKLEKEINELVPVADKSNKDKNRRSTAMKKLALIHSGIIPLEQEIQIYINKYAETQKIKTLVDTFEKKLDDIEANINLEKQIRDNKDKQKKIRSELSKLQQQVENGNESKIFLEKINSIDFSTEIADQLEDIQLEFQLRIQQQQAKSDKGISKKEAQTYCDQLCKFVGELSLEVQVKLEDLIKNSLINSANTIYQDYKKQLESFSKDIDFQTIEINPYSLVSSCLIDPKQIQEFINRNTIKQKVASGQKWIANTDKKWYKPWTWFEESGWYKDTYKTEEKISRQKLSDLIMVPARENLLDNICAAKLQAEQMTDLSKETYRSQIEKVDKLLLQKLIYLKSLTAENADMENELNSLNANLKWLNNIKEEENKILNFA